MNTTVSMILASASPRRKELLRYLVPHFEVMPADIDEETLPTTCSLFEQPLYLAEKKAAALATQHPDALILGCFCQRRDPWKAKIRARCLPDAADALRKNAHRSNRMLSAAKQPQTCVL